MINNKCMPQVKPEIETFAKIKVIGVGGSGGSAVDRMVKAGIRGVDFYAVNTDVQALHHNSAPHKIHIGKTVTRGLGAGMDPELGKRSAEESQTEIRDMLKDANMVFITCGLGGGTGSGASPVVAQISRELGILTIAVVTKPFSFEGQQRKKIADKAYEKLSQNVDTIITIPNDRVLQIIDKKTTLLESFRIIDDVLRQGVQGISELITVPGEINVDFADVQSIMNDTGSALMGIGMATGENRAVEAAKAAVSSPLLDVSIDGARGILFTVTASSSLGMQEVSDAAKVITSSADEDAKVIFGTVIDENMKDELRITVVATGFDDERINRKIDREKEEEARPFMGVNLNRNFYSTTSVSDKTSSKEEIEEKEVEEVPKRTGFIAKKVFSHPEEEVKPLKIKPTFSAPKVDHKNEENKKNDDLEIPAFIRRKMGM